MGATCTLFRLSDRSLRELLEEPARLQPFLMGQTMPFRERQGFLQRLLGKKTREIQPVTETREEGDFCELDATRCLKLWGQSSSFCFLGTSRALQMQNGEL